MAIQQHLETDVVAARVRHRSFRRRLGDHCTDEQPANCQELNSTHHLKLMLQNACPQPRTMDASFSRAGAAERVASAERVDGARGISRASWTGTRLRTYKFARDIDSRVFDRAMGPGARWRAPRPADRDSRGRR